MVYEDIARPSASQVRPLALVHDRFLAFAFDVCLWVPIGFLLMKPLWRRIQYLSVTASASGELLGLFALTILLTLLLFVGAQAIFTWLSGATPGQKIFQIEIVTLEGGRPSFGACLTRSFVWAFELALLGIPLLEVMSHPQRRPWHDRIAETIVVTKKNVGAEPPHWLEQRFFRNLYWGFLLVALVFTAGQIKGLFRAVQHGEMKRAELTKAGYLCDKLTQALPEAHVEPSARLDLGVAMYLAGDLTRECLESEADFVIWTQDEESLAWAHLARGVFNEGRSSETKAEFQRVCELAPRDSPVCLLAGWRLGGELPSGASETWIYKVGKIKELVRSGSFDRLDRFVASVNWPAAMSTTMQAKRLQSLWVSAPENEFSASMDVLRIGWEPDLKVKMQSWACLAELTKRCGPAPIGACEQLREDLQNEPADWDAPVVLALTRESICRNRKDTLVQNLFMRTFQKGKQNHQWLMDWLYPMAHQTVEARFKSIYVAAQTLSTDDWLYAQALDALVQLSMRKEHLMKVSDLLAKSSSEDMLWWAAQRAYFAKAKKMGVDLQPDVQLRAPSATEEKK